MNLKLTYFLFHSTQIGCKTVYNNNNNYYYYHNNNNNDNDTDWGRLAAKLFGSSRLKIKETNKIQRVMMVMMMMVVMVMVMVKRMMTFHHDDECHDSLS